MNLIKIINDRLNKKMKNYYNKTEVDNKISSKLSTTGGTITGNISGNGGGQFCPDGNVFMKCHGYDGYLSTILGNIENKTPKIIQCAVISQNTNVQLSPKSMYLFISMTDISGEEYNQYVCILTTGTTTVNRAELYNTLENSPWQNLPTNSSLIQGLYPKTGAYVHTTIVKLY